MDEVVRTRWFVAALAAGAALAIAGAVVLLSSGGGAPREPLPADASTALRQLARVAADRPPPPDLRQGGYWYVREREDRPKPYVNEVWLDVGGTGRFRTTAQGTAGADGEQSGVLKRWREWTLRNLYNLPREPAALERAWHKYDDGTPTRPDKAVTSRVSSFAGLLGSLPLPGDLRAGLFELLARESAIGFAGAVEIRGRRGWGFDTPRIEDRFTRVVIDPATSAVIATQTMRGDGVESEREYLAAGRVPDARTVPPDGLTAP